MKLYCMSDIHGCIDSFEESLSMIMDQLKEKDTKLILLGDYIHGPNSCAVLDRVMELQREYGIDKVIALMGNHEDMVLDGRMPISENKIEGEKKRQYLIWIKKLPRYYVEGNTIFVHAGVEEDAKDMWRWGTDDYTFTEKFPAQTGKFYGDWKIVAGHIGTSTIADDREFHDIYYDGEAHYYIDGSVLYSGRIPILLVHTEEDKYYQVYKQGKKEVLLYHKK